MSGVLQNLMISFHGYMIREHYAVIGHSAAEIYTKSILMLMNLIEVLRNAFPFLIKVEKSRYIEVILQLALKPGIAP